MGWDGLWPLKIISFFEPSQSLGWTKHFTSYKPKIIDPICTYMYIYIYIYIFVLRDGWVREFMVLQDYFTYFEHSQSLGWAKSKDPCGKKIPPDHLHLPYTVQFLKIQTNMVALPQSNAFKRCRHSGKQCRPWSDCTSRSSLIWIYTVCSDLPVRKLIIMVYKSSISCLSP